MTSGQCPDFSPTAYVKVQHFHVFQTNDHSNHDQIPVIFFLQKLHHLICYDYIIQSIIAKKTYAERLSYFSPAAENSLLQKFPDYPLDDLA